METSRLVLLLTIFLMGHFISEVFSQSRVRYRPSTAEKCDRQGRCSPKDGYIEEADESYKSDKERPDELTRDGWPSTGGGRPGIGSDYNSKPSVSGDSYISKDPERGQDTKPAIDAGNHNPKPVITAGGGSRDYIPKPVIDSDSPALKPIVSSSESRDYNLKPVRDRDNYNPKPIVSDKGDRDYNPKPVADRDEYNPKPKIVSGGGGAGGTRNYNPDRDSYEPKPAVTAGGGSRDYNPKPATDRDSPALKPVVSSSGSRDYNSKPVSDRDNYNPKPIVSDTGGRDYNPKPVADRDEYNSKPKIVNGGGGAGGHRNYNPDRDSYESKPVISGGTSGNYDSKPIAAVDREDGGAYNRKPIVDRGNYDTKPVVDRGDYDIKPAISSGTRGGYNSKPNIDRVPVIARDEVGYNSKPNIDRVPVIARDEVGYNRKPTVDRGNYETKPADVRGDYDEKPVNSGRLNGGYNSKPVADREVYDVKPVIISGSGGYDRKPSSDRDDYNRKPSRGNIEELFPKPPADEDYRPPTRGGSRGSNRRPSVSRDDYDPVPISRDNIRRPIPKPLRDSGRDAPRHKPRPSSDRDEYYPIPEHGSRYQPAPVDDYIPKPVGGGNDRYRHPDRGEDLGGYYDSKDDDEDYGYDLKEDDYDSGISASVKEGKCICVPYYQCAGGRIVTDGGGIIDARKRPDPQTETTADGKLPSCGPFHVCCNTPETSTMVPYQHRCGVRNPFGVNSRILSPSNKGEADFGEWPWQAAVLKAEGKVNIFQCGGVLIDKYHVITVAHCVFHLYQYNEYPLKVRLGEWDTQMTTEFLAHADYKVAKILVHPEFKNTSLWNDIAILKLEEPVLFAPHIDSVCLPQYDENFAGQNCVVTGWGKDAYKGGTFSNVMKEVVLEVTDNYKCEEMLRKTRLGRFFQLHEGFLCAGGEYGLDSCKGDGGGPLVCYRKNKSYALAGIVSWGIDCGQPGVPGVYVKIQKYLDWISKTTGVPLDDYWPKY